MFFAQHKSSYTSMANSYTKPSVSYILLKHSVLYIIFAVFLPRFLQNRNSHF